MIGCWCTFLQRRLGRSVSCHDRVIAKDDPDITVAKVNFHQHGKIQIHQSRVQRCPLSFPEGCHWYGCKRPDPGRPPKWVEKLLSDGLNSSSEETKDQSHFKYKTILYAKLLCGP